MPLLTQKQREQYMATAGVRCPYCESDQVVGDSFDVEVGEVRQDVSCNNCEETWVAIYSLVRVEEIE